MKTHKIHELDPSGPQEAYTNLIDDFMSVIEPYCVSSEGTYIAREKHFGYLGALSVCFAAEGLRSCFKALWEDKLFFVPGEDWDYREHRKSPASIYITYVGLHVVLQEKTTTHAHDYLTARAFVRAAVFGSAVVSGHAHDYLTARAFVAWKKEHNLC